MTRVLVWVPDLFRLGPAAEVLHVAREVATRGIDLQLVTPGGRKASDSVGEKFGVPIHFVGRSGFHWTAWGELQALTRRLQPDLVHNWCGPIWVDRVWNWLRKSRVLTCDSLARVREQVAKVRRVPMHILLSETCWVDDRASFKPDFQLRGNEISSSRYPAEMPPPLNDPSRVRARLRSDLRMPADVKIMVAVSPLQPWAGLKDLIWATDLLGCIRDDVHLVIVGRGKHQGRLERFSRLTEVASKIHFVGHVDDPVGLIQGADCYWQASPHRFGRLAVRAAMSGGVPVVSCVGPVASGLVLHQQTGLCVQPGSREAYARWTKYLLEQGHHRDQLVRQAREHCSRIQTGGKLAELLTNLYVGGSTQTSV